ncbi:MAG: hypothetical protein EI684_05135 [Candidatus Viridilinea halotolerans]|uniref:Uncharacterized protein n=1 Tax=Candidatus Viridilinea halotolerans TaxID=2491704 RepID=A0A426U5T6_9CHLR|nr:MAG: hypothetical protein EI684_05135 [Candidatus Viridilinea halotolerans]
MSRRTPTAAEIARFAQDAVETMLDQCHLLRFTAAGQDARGIPHASYVRSAPTPCGFARRSRREVLGDAQVPVEHATLRLPWTIAVTTLDRIVLTHRMGRELPEPIVYEITDLRPGVAQHLLDLKPAGDPGNEIP